MWPILSTVTVSLRIVCRLCSLTLYSWIGLVHLLGGGDGGVREQLVKILDQLDGSAPGCRQ